MMHRPRIAFTIGDINGIGVEVMVKALLTADLLSRCRPLIVGSTRLIADYLNTLQFEQVSVGSDVLEIRGTDIPIFDLPSDASFSPGTSTARAGRLAGAAIERGTVMVLQGEADALVTLPISKAGLHAGGYDFPGHTEMLASLTGGTPLMILLTEGLRVGLATIHIPLREVAETITQQLLEQRITALRDSLRFDFAIPVPRIAVLGLNPHAGEHGEIGCEEEEIITPVVERLAGEGMELTGPHPADGFFARFRANAYDGVLAMYHDQGLIPLKFLARGAGVNVTAGLPIVRTSPDHGTAFDLAGRGVADARSTVLAVETAINISENRMKAGGTEG